jgi:acyl-CoA thioester hydrolase
MSVATVPFQPFTGRPAEDLPVPAGIAFWAEMTVPAEGVSDGVPHVNNVEYVRWVDRLAEMATDAAGFTRARHLREGTMWFVARHEIDYRGEAFAGDEILAATWIIDGTRTTVRRATFVVRPVDGRVLCSATTRWALVNLETRKPMRIPAAIREAFKTAAEVEPA